MATAYLGCFDDLVALPSGVADKLDPLGHLTQAFDSLEGVPFRVNLVQARKLVDDKDLLAKSPVIIYEATPVVPHKKPYEYIMKQFSNSQLIGILEIMVAVENLKPIAMVLCELTGRNDDRDLLSVDILRQLDTLFPPTNENAPAAYARGALVRYYLAHGRGSLDIARECSRAYNGAEAVATYILQEQEKALRETETGDFVGYFAHHLGVPNVPRALQRLVEHNSENAKKLHDSVLVLCHHVSEGDEPDIMLDILRCAALSSPKTQTVLLSKLPFFLTLTEHKKRRAAALRMVCSILHCNTMACSHLRTIGLPKLVDDLELVKLYETMSVTDKSIRADLRSKKLSNLWKIVETSTVADTIGAILHVLTLVLLKDNEQVVVEDLLVKSVEEKWIDKVVSPVKQNPFSEPIQQFGIELLTLLGAANQDGLLKSGAHVLARVASKEYPENSSLQNSHKWLAEIASSSDEIARQVYT